MEHKLEHSWKIDFIKFLSGTVSLTKNISTDQVYMNTIEHYLHRESAVHTLLEEAAYSVRARSVAGANHKKYCSLGEASGRFSRGYSSEWPIQGSKWLVHPRITQHFDPQLWPASAPQPHFETLLNDPQVQDLT